jgi:MFS family permease
MRYLTENIWHHYISCVLWGLGIVFAGGTMASTVVRRWFDKDIGKMTGIVMSANGIGGAIAAQIISPIINNGEVFGYRKAYLLSAVIAFVIAALVMVFLRDNPSDSAPASVSGKKKPKGAIWEGLPYERIKKKPYFYMTAAMVFLTGISLASIGSITFVYMADLGLPDSFIAIYATLSSLFLTFSKLFVGACYDKRGLRFTMLICQISAVASFVLKLILSNSTQGMVFAIIAVILTALATPMETVMIPLLTGDLFGLASYDKILGILGAANSLGLCLGSFLGDLSFDLFGTYIPCFAFFTISMVAVIFGYRFVFRASSVDKEALSEEKA